MNGCGRVRVRLRASHIGPSDQRKRCYATTCRWPCVRAVHHASLAYPGIGTNQRSNPFSRRLSVSRPLSAERIGRLGTVRLSFLNAVARYRHVHRFGLPGRGLVEPYAVPCHSTALDPAQRRRRQPSSSTAAKRLSARSEIDRISRRVCHSDPAAVTETSSRKHPPMRARSSRI